MNFIGTRSPEIVRTIIAAGYDRPEMLADGADLARIPVLDSWQYFVAYDEREILGLIAGTQQSPVCLDIHVCLVVRGARAIAALRQFFRWLPEATGYRKVIGQIPAYNRPMRYIARKAGARELARSRNSTTHHGELADQLIFEKDL